MDNFVKFRILDKIQLKNVFGGQDPVGHVRTVCSRGTDVQVTKDITLPDTYEDYDSAPICC